jgi:hypothetical protein
MFTETGVWAGTTAEIEETQPLASVTETMYVPLARLLIEVVVAPPGLHKYWYGGFPPVAETVAVPLLAIHGISVTVTETEAPPILLRLAELVAVHPELSVTVTAYVPVPRLLMVAVVAPPGLHKYEYPPLPPDAVILTEPFVLPQEGCTTVGVEIVTAEPTVMVPEACAVFDAASVTVTE